MQQRPAGYKLKWRPVLIAFGIWAAVVIIVSIALVNTKYFATVLPAVALASGWVFIVGPALLRRRARSRALRAQQSRQQGRQRPGRR
jgi:hypothetical protein